MGTFVQAPINVTKTGVQRLQESPFVEAIDVSQVMGLAWLKAKQPARAQILLPENTFNVFTDEELTWRRISFGIVAIIGAGCVVGAFLVAHRLISRDGYEDEEEEEEEEEVVDVMGIMNGGCIKILLIIRPLVVVLRRHPFILRRLAQWRPKSEDRCPVGVS